MIIARAIRPRRRRSSVTEPPAEESVKRPAPTDAEFDQHSKLLDLERKEADLQRRWDELATEQENRRLRGSIAVGALIVMIVQIIAANGIFVWYGDTNGWDIPAAAISAWLGATVVQVVAVVLVIMKYLFPKGGPRRQ